MNKTNLSKVALCFDLDGTLADLYGVPNWLEQLKAENTQPYEQAKPLVNMQKLNEELKALQAQGAKVIILSWLAKESTKEYEKQVRRAKKEWCKYYNIPFDEIHCRTYGTPKQQMYKASKYELSLLFDDDKNVRENFLRPCKNRFAFSPSDIFNCLRNANGILTTNTI